MNSGAGVLEDLKERVHILQQRVAALEELQKFEMDVQIALTSNLENDFDELAQDVEDCKSALNIRNRGSKDDESG